MMAKFPKTFEFDIIVLPINKGGYMSEFEINDFYVQCVNSRCELFTSENVFNVVESTRVSKC